MRSARTPFCPPRNSQHPAPRANALQATMPAVSLVVCAGEVPGSFSRFRFLSVQTRIGRNVHQPSLQHRPRLLSSLGPTRSRHSAWDPHNCPLAARHGIPKTSQLRTLGLAPACRMVRTWSILLPHVKMPMARSPPSDVGTLSPKAFLG